MRPIYVLSLLAGALMCAAASYGCGPEDCARRRRCVQPEGEGGSGGGNGGAGGGFTDLGTACAEPTECQSGQCVDGVCCDAACDGVCQSCKVAELEGVCTPYDGATDPETECGGGVCDGASACANGEVVALTRYGGIQYSLARAVAGGSGRMVLVGEANADIDFGVGVISPSDSSDPFVVSFDQETGAAEWDRLFEGEVDVADVAMDSVGNVFTVGGVNIGAKIGGIVQTSGGPVVIKLSPSGTVQWTNVFESQGAVYMPATAADQMDGGVFVVGEFADHINFGGGWLNGLLGRLFVAKVDSDGEYVWAKNFGPTTKLSDNTLGSKLTMASSATGMVALSSIFTGEIDVGGGLWSSDDGGGVVVVMDALGGHVWSLQFPAMVEAMAFDDNGGLMLLGRFGSTMNLGGEPLVSVGGGTLFGAAFDAAGKHRWSRSYSTGHVEVLGADVDRHGNLVMAGGLGGTATIAGTELVSDNHDGLVIKFAGSTGEPLWARQFGGAEEQNARGVVASGDDIIVVGDFLNVMSAGDLSVGANGDEDVFVARLTQ